MKIRRFLENERRVYMNKVLSILSDLDALASTTSTASVALLRRMDCTRVYELVFTAERLAVELAGKLRELRKGLEERCSPWV